MTETTTDEQKLIIKLCRFIAKKVPVWEMGDEMQSMIAPFIKEREEIGL